MFLCSWLSTCLLTLFLLLASTSAEDPALYHSADYNNGALGTYPTQHFVTTSVIVPRPNFIHPFTKCDDGSYLFIAPRGEVANSSVVILDTSGNLIWATSNYTGHAYNLHVQQYRGQDYLIYWAGNNANGHGAGKYYMLNQHYELVHEIDAAGKYAADLHSIHFTPTGSVVLTIYDVAYIDIAKHMPAAPKPAGSSTYRRPPSVPEKGWVADCLFQEIDVETGELLFEWRASDHFSFTESYDPLRSYTEEKPWDWFHINSVEKDAAGNYLISVRHLRCIAYISGQDGSVLWQVGGRSNKFKDSSGGKATQLLGQHDARFFPGSHSSITFFDNRGDWNYHIEKKSIGTRIQLDFEQMTASVVQQYMNTANVYSVSQGSYQTLPNGHVVLGYGNNGVMTEFDANGTTLCEMYFGPSRDWTTGNVQSYRNLRFNWTGTPKTSPTAVLNDSTLYVSWMGTTETSSWLLLHSSAENGTFREVFTFPKSGFETAFTFLGDPDLLVREYIQVGALDRSGHILAVSNTVFIGDLATVPANETWPSDLIGDFDDLEDDMEADEVLDLEDDAVEDLEVLISFVLLAAISSVAVCWIFLGSRILRHKAWGATALARKVRWEGAGGGAALVRGGQMARAWQTFGTKVAQVVEVGRRTVVEFREKGRAYRRLNPNGEDEDHEMSSSSNSSEFSGPPP